MKSLIKNKKGAGKIISVYWFVILLLIAGGIFLMIYLFYGAPIDVRLTEAHILANQVADCVSYAGRINSDLISNGIPSANKETFLENCHLNFVSSDWTSEQYYAQVSFYKIDNLENPIFSIKKGNSDWLSDCAIQEEKEFEKLAQCNEFSFYSTDNMNNQYIIKILTTVRKSEKNVKL